MNSSYKTADFFDLKAPKISTGNCTSALNVELMARLKGEEAASV
jgi:hypothetical protein